MNRLTHFDDHGASRMVDVSQKTITSRKAIAEGFVLMKPETLRIIKQQSEGSGEGLPKGNVLEVARLAGIMAAKKADDIIPLCHSLGLDGVEIGFEFVDETRIRICSSVFVTARTGVEMEALTSVSVCALTIYDMCKSIDREMQITEIRLIEKSGGRSGHFRRDNSEAGENSKNLSDQMTDAPK